MRQLAGTSTRFRRTYAARLVGLISHCVEYSAQFAAGLEAFVPAAVAGAEVVDSGTTDDGFVAVGGVTSTVLEHPNKMHETSRKHINDCRTVNSVVWFSMYRVHQRNILRRNIVRRKFNALWPKSKR